jgi:hypothetical protein
MYYSECTLSVYFDTFFSKYTLINIWWLPRRWMFVIILGLRVRYEDDLRSYVVNDQAAITTGMSLISDFVSS